MANKKIFKNIYVFNKFMKIFGFGLNYFVIQINTINYSKKLILHLFNVYVKIVKKFSNLKL